MQILLQALQSFMAKSIIFISLNIKLLLQNSHLNCSELINNAFQWSPASENNNRLRWMKCTHTHLAKHSTEHTPDDFFEGVKEQVLSPWLGWDLLQEEGQVIAQAADGHAT